MGLFDFINKRSATPENPSTDLSNPAEWLVNWLGGKAKTGKSITVKDALQVTPFWAAVRVISESVGQLGVDVLKIDGSKRIKDTNHSIYTLVSSEPNAKITSQQFYETVAAHLCLYGNAFALIERNPSTAKPISINLIDPTQVEVGFSSDGKRLKYKVKGVDTLIDSDDILHFAGLSFDGLKGYSPLQAGKEALGIASATNAHSAEHFANGGTLTGVLNVNKPLKKEQKDIIGEQWQKNYGENGSKKTAVLDANMKFTPIQSDPEKSQLLEARKFNVEEVSRIFRIPLFMLNSMESSSTRANVEEQNITFVRGTLMPYLKRIENELERKLLPIKDRTNTRIKFNVNQLLRGDSKARAEFYKELFYLGVLSPNDIRGLEDLNPIDNSNGDKYYVQQNLMLMDNIDNRDKANINSTNQTPPK